MTTGSEKPSRPGPRIRRGRVGFVYPMRWLDSIPSLANAISILTEQGYLVDVYTSGTQNIRSFGPGVELIEYPGRLPVGSAGKSKVRSQTAKLLSVVPAALRFWFRHWRSRYRCLLGVDPEGLVEANRISALTRVPLAYYSLELLLSDEIEGPGDLLLKKKEKALMRRVEFAIIQDRDRARLLGEDNDLDERRILLVPNAPLSGRPVGSERYWHDRFGLSDSTRVALHAGSVDEWTGLESIVQFTSEWPPDWVFVIHTKERPDGPLMEHMREVSPEGRVLFSFDPVSRTEYDQLLESSNAGIAFYVPSGTRHTQKNIIFAGLSSGKVAYHLRAGVPVIVNAESISLARFIDSTGAGVVVESASQISAALAQIELNQEQFSEAAKRAFADQLDFAGSFDAVLKRLEEL
ncbi:MAG TPA: hypothetical protein VND22_08185 [Actinomycetota bacterium]|nr:hypothetical protein [Actinomycetota bacterium]